MAPIGKGGAGLDVSTLANGPKIDPSDIATLRGSACSMLTSYLTAALHLAIPAAKEAGFAADVFVNTVPKFYHHYQSNAAATICGKLRGKAGVGKSP